MGLRTKLFGLATIATLGVAGVISAPAASANAVHATVLRCSAPAGVICPDPSVGNSAAIRLNLSGYVSLDKVCFTLGFSRNLLDPGEQYELTANPQHPPIGAFNPTATPQSSRTTCAVTGFQDQFLSDLLQAHTTTPVTAYMANGTARLQSVTIAVTGTRVIP